MCKCIDCAFLATRRLQSTASCEATKAVRSFQQNHGFDFIPHCYKEVIDIGSLDGNRGDHREIKRQLEQERDCKKFTQWEPGIGPRDQIDLDLKKIADAAVEERFNKAEARTIERENERNAKNDCNARITIVICVITMLATIAQAIAAWYMK